MIGVNRVSFKSAAKIEQKAVDNQTPLRAVLGPGVDFAACLGGRWACMEHLLLDFLPLCFSVSSLPQDELELPPALWE